MPEPHARPATGPHDIPSAPELVAAVRTFLERDVVPAAEGRVRFHARVAANVLSMVERELRHGGPDAEAHAVRLAALGAADDADLARAIREGRLNDGDPELVRLLRESVRDKLRVANPAYLGES
ncbi:DUF6285 domain-containing protein [Bailinhaonella thermotolerans]|uniref:DUF6285 domain-containing protein n=1 Tax=Bailinhaonella thermotolerans TaxID=1070861 RepID=A0A3A4A179_9ACTN|nr:DUF6285 domain-containing protein [Bailinhaonella thermotolerans]RJL20803.1 hypothetical protein D5H75_38760 [Bailinhaonella thermotolerans]